MTTTAPTAVIPPRANTLPGEYEILALAAGGTFCEVWQVRERGSNKLCALKLLRGEWQDHRAARKLLENEAEVGQRVKSPHVVCVIDTPLRHAPRCVVLEWLAGITLEKLLAERNALPPLEALWYARQAAQGLLDLHVAGFSHGDVKPANMFIGDDGNLKLIDLGFARPIRTPGDARDLGYLAGTPEYMAPESVTPQAEGVAKDIYGLGVTLYRMLTGRLPFQGETPADILRQQQTALPTSPRLVTPHLPRELADFSLRLLSKQPLRRATGLPGLVRELITHEIAALPNAM